MRRAAGMIVGCAAGLAAPAAPAWAQMTCAPAQRAAAEGWRGDYTWWIVHRDVVSYSGPDRTGARWEFVTEHCPSRQRMIADVPFGDMDARDRIARARGDAEAGEAVFSLRSLARHLRAQGARAEVVTVDYESCACAGLAEVMP
jgi:hypothetical protein